MIISLDEVKDYLVIEDDEHDELLKSLIKAAEEWAETYCGHSLKSDPDKKNKDEDENEVPEKFKQALRFLVAHWFENRNMVSGNMSLKEIPFAVTSLLSQTRRIPL